MCIYILRTQRCSHVETFNRSIQRTKENVIEIYFWQTEETKVFVRWYEKRKIDTTRN